MNNLGLWTPNLDLVIIEWTFESSRCLWPTWAKTRNGETLEFSNIGTSVLEVSIWEFCWGDNGVGIWECEKEVGEDVDDVAEVDIEGVDVEVVWLREDWGE